jgi:hypothetical protein
LSTASEISPNVPESQRIRQESIDKFPSLPEQCAQHNTCDERRTAQAPFQCWQMWVHTPGGLTQRRTGLSIIAVWDSNTRRG